MALFVIDLATVLVYAYNLDSLMQAIENVDLASSFVAT